VRRALTVIKGIKADMSWVGLVGSAECFEYLEGGESNGKGEIQGSLRYGGKCAAFGRDDVLFGRFEEFWRTVGKL
jgi:hypothetical protein